MLVPPTVCQGEPTLVPGGFHSGDTVNMNRAAGHSPAIPALKRLECCKLEANLSCIMSFCLKTNRQARKKKLPEGLDL